MRYGVFRTQVHLGAGIDRNTEQYGSKILNYSFVGPPIFINKGGYHKIPVK
jgi:hypothetical protein